MIRRYIIVAEDSIKGFDEGIAKLEREWGAEEIEPCEDAISREAVIKIVEQYPVIIGNRYSGLIADIEHLPSVTPIQKTGKWEVYTDINADHRCTCSNCKKWITVLREDTIPNFCPNCGVIMDGDSDE